MGSITASTQGDFNCSSCLNVPEGLVFLLEAYNNAEPIASQGGNLRRLQVDPLSSPPSTYLVAISLHWLIRILRLVQAMAWVSARGGVCCWFVVPFSLWTPRGSLHMGIDAE